MEVSLIIFELPLSTKYKEKTNISNLNKKKTPWFISIQKNPRVQTRQSTKSTLINIQSYLINNLQEGLISSFVMVPAGG
jgi:hypothetical protein